MSYIKAIPAVLTKSANYTVSTNDGDNVQVNTSASGGAVTITFYAASGNAGKIITVKKTDSSANAVTLDGNASETLDGATTATLTAQYDSATFVCDGTNWQKVASTLAPLDEGLSQTFRGLTLRTHPDADVAAYKVFLDHADEIVMNDGTRVADWDNLVADITASGAGGLDTGSEGSSRWYEIHAIRKSSDGTKNLLLHRAKDYLLDESYTTSNNVSNLRSSSSNVKVGQTFDTDVTGPFEIADFKINRNGSPSGRVWASIYATSGGLPTGSALKTSDKIDASLVSTSAQVIRFPFRDPQTLTAGTTYAVVLEGDYAVDGANYLQIAYDTTGTYSAGAHYIYNGSAWSAGGGDLWFNVYVTQNDTAVTMPSGYDQRALIGYVYNNSSSNLLPMRAQNKDVYQYSVAVSNVTTTIPTLVDLAAILPPVPVLLTILEIRGSSVSSSLEINPGIGRYGNHFGFFYTFANADTFNDVGCSLPIEFQHFYFDTTAGNCFIYPLTYRW